MAKRHKNCNERHSAALRQQTSAIFFISASTSSVGTMVAVDVSIAPPITPTDTSMFSNAFSNALMLMAILSGCIDLRLRRASRGAAAARAQIVRQELKMNNVAKAENESGMG